MNFKEVRQYTTAQLLGIKEEIIETLTWYKTDCIGAWKTTFYQELQNEKWFINKLLKERGFSV